MWRGSREVLSDIDLDVRRGEIVTLIGPNGAGKTTLVRMLLGIEQPDRGRISNRPRRASATFRNASKSTRPSR